MTNRELVLNMLAELTTKALSENSDPQTMQQHAEVAVKGATVACNAKSIHKSIEAKNEKEQTDSYE